jgi:2-polyprenyl-6-methoxyphenol hydroxylase-like FAD-dependent oxidoreductase
MVALQSIIIVGAGPAGLFLALLLARSGIPNLRVRVLEREIAPTIQTRAVFYLPGSFFEFERAGMLDAVKAAAFQPRSVAFRDQADGGKTLFDMKGGMVALTSDRLAGIAQEVSGGTDPGGRANSAGAQGCWPRAGRREGMDRY